ncbi:F-box protein At5g07610-like [Curcuma longa]|uniref:F-box protein At5g07610-like n=1 Tax=Curcuma longa TaxID=136217 RepID=UPI003D9EE0B2
MATDIVAGKGEKYEGGLLPHDLLLEIFSYLPAKKILQLQLLSKSFRRLAANPCFRLLQSRRNVGASGVFVDESWEHQSDFNLLNPMAGFSPLMLSFLELAVPNFAELVVSSRGLLFYRYRKYDGGFFVVNPACNEVRMIPARPDKCCKTPWRGLAVKFVDDDDHLKCKYQLVCLLTEEDYWFSNVYQFCFYDSAAGEWIVEDKQVDISPQSSLDLSNLVVFENSVFGYSVFKSCVIAIDTSTMLVDLLTAPDSVAPDDPTSLAVWEEAGKRPWLCLVHYDRRSRKFTLWRRLKGSMWVKFDEAVADRQRYGKRLYGFYLCDGGIMNGMLLFFNGDDDQTYAYSFKRRQFWLLETKKRLPYREFFAYSNSLQPC